MWGFWNLWQHPYAPHVHDPGDSKDSRIATPRICQTDLAGLIAGISVTRTLFQRYLPKNNKIKKIMVTVKKETRARRPGAASTRPLPSNVSVWEKAAFTLFAITPPSIFSIYKKNILVYEFREFLSSSARLIWSLRSCFLMTVRLSSKYLMSAFARSSSPSKKFLQCLRR